MVPPRTALAVIVGCSWLPARSDAPFSRVLCRTGPPCQLARRSICATPSGRSRRAGDQGNGVEGLWRRTPSSRGRVGSRAGYGQDGVAGDVPGQVLEGQPHWLVVPGGIEAELVGEVGACGQAALAGGDHVDGGEVA